MEGLRNPAVNNFNTIFYSGDENIITLSFSWENFIVFVPVKYDEILVRYPNLDNDAETKLSNYKGHPSVVKFIEEFTFGRGIPEMVQ